MKRLSKVLFFVVDVLYSDLVLRLSCSLKRITGSGTLFVSVRARLPVPSHRKLTLYWYDEGGRDGVWFSSNLKRSHMIDINEKIMCHLASFDKDVERTTPYFQVQFKRMKGIPFKFECMKAACETSLLIDSTEGV